MSINVVDHRWGVRQSLNLKVGLLKQDSKVASGLITDISLSGAFVRSEQSVPVHARVRVLIAGMPDGSAKSAVLAANVVRQDCDGFALEWWSLTPGLLRRILSLHAQLAIPQLA